MAIWGNRQKGEDGFVQRDSPISIHFFGKMITRLEGKKNPKSVEVHQNFFGSLLAKPNLI